MGLASNELIGHFALIMMMTLMPTFISEMQAVHLSKNETISSKNDSVGLWSVSLVKQHDHPHARQLTNILHPLAGMHPNPHSLAPHFGSGSGDKNETGNVVYDPNVARKNNNNNTDVVSKNDTDVISRNDADVVSKNDIDVATIRDSTVGNDSVVTDNVSGLAS